MAETSGKGLIFHCTALLRQGYREAAQVISRHPICRLVDLARWAPQPGGGA
jgi:hypothetical protein